MSIAMLGPRPAGHVPGLPAAVLAVILAAGPPGILVAGCSHAPVLSESVARLHTDARAVLRQSAASLSPPGTRPVLSPATKLPCPAGGARAFLQGRIPLHSAAASKPLLDHAGQFALGLLTDRGYRLQRPPPNGRHRHGFTMRRGVPEVDLTVRLTAGPRPMLLLEGSTPCLPE